MNGHQEYPPNPQRGYGHYQGPPPRPYDDRLVYRPIIPRPLETNAIQMFSSPPRRTSRNWSGWIVFLLVLIAALVAFLNLPSLKAFFATMENAGSHDPTQQFKGLATFGIIMVSILAAMRIALDRNKDRSDE